MIGSIPQVRYMINWRKPSTADSTRPIFFNTTTYVEPPPKQSTCRVEKCEDGGYSMKVIQLSRWSATTMDDSRMANATLPGNSMSPPHDDCGNYHKDYEL